MPLGLGIEEWQKPEWRANQSYSAVGMAKLADHLLTGPPALGRRTHRMRSGGKVNGEIVYLSVSFC
jgi:hypothetical protein